jgi:sec-independent protein translocase protein TatB
MFDLSFTHMAILAVVALVVIGPERLPRVARTLGHLYGRMQRYVTDVKADINREIELDELRKFKDQFQDAARSVETSIREGVHKAEAEARAMQLSVEEAVNPTGESTADSIHYDVIETRAAAEVRSDEAAQMVTGYEAAVTGYEAALAHDTIAGDAAATPAGRA